MKEKHVNLALSTVFLAMDAVVLYVAFTARKYKGAVVGPFDFSKYLGIALAVLVGINVVNTLRSKDGNEKVKIQNFDLALATIAATALLLIFWQVTDAFYIVGYFYMMALTALYNAKCGTLTKKSIPLILLLPLGIQVMIYVLFKVLMGIVL